MIRLYLTSIFYLLLVILLKKINNIITNENKTLLIEESREIEEESDSLLEDPDIKTLKEQTTENIKENVNNKNAIVIKDMPNNSNLAWHLV